MTTRTEIARAASEALSRAALDRHRAIVGFDGFVDAIIDVVDQRRSMAPHDYTRLETITEYAKRCADAAGKSTNMELVVKEERFGGNGPLMAGGLAQLGVPTTYVGCVGQEESPTDLHHLYRELRQRCQRSGGDVMPLSPPAHTTALEFDDGKIMLGDPRNIQRVSWAMLVEVIGLDALRAMVLGSSLVGIVNWVMMAGVQSILQGLTSDVLSNPGAATPPRVFIDLCDPAKRTNMDIEAVLGAMTSMNTHAPVTLGLNLAESERIAVVCKARAYPIRFPGQEPNGEMIRDAAIAIRETLKIDTVVIHPRGGAGGSTASGRAEWFDGPLVKKPKLSTGAGDHFNSGFAMAQIHGLPIDQCLAVGCGVSGAYVRDAESPTRARLVEFLRDLPSPE